MADVVPIEDHVGFERERAQSCNRTLAQARSLGPSEVLVIGTDRDGHLFVGAYPNDPGNALWLMEMAKLQLLRGHVLNLAGGDVGG